VGPLGESGDSWLGRSGSGYVTSRLHSPILWTSFNVLVQEIVERRLECKHHVPPLVHLPFDDLQASWLDHPRSLVSRWGGLTGAMSGLTISGGGITSSGSDLTTVLCRPIRSAMVF
jgi:hypothetical protein